MDVSPKTMKKLEDMNSLFLANLFGVSKRGCPTVSLYSESSTLLISNQILLTQLLFLHHIATLPRTSLANEIYQTMKVNNYPGIVKNCQKYLTEWNMTDAENYTKMAWKKVIKKKIQMKNWNELPEHMYFASSRALTISLISLYIVPKGPELS